MGTNHSGQVITDTVLVLLVGNWTSARVEYNNKQYKNLYFGGNCVWQTSVPLYERKQWFGQAYNKNINSRMKPLYNAQTAYDQGKFIAQQLNNLTCESYEYKHHIQALYVGNGFYALYRDDIDAYFLIPSCFVNLYYRLFTS